MQTIVRRSIRITLCAVPSDGSATALPVATVSPGLAAPCARPRSRCPASRRAASGRPRGGPRAAAGRPRSGSASASAALSASSRKPRSARVMRMTASSTCSSTWLSTRVEFRVWTSDSRSCCCSIQGNSAICSVRAVARRAGENFRVTLPSWICAPWRQLAPSAPWRRSRRRRAGCPGPRWRSRRPRRAMRACDLGDRRLGQAEVVVAGAAERVGRAASGSRSSPAGCRARPRAAPTERLAPQWAQRCASGPFSPLHFGHSMGAR